MRNPFRYFKTSPDFIRLEVMKYIRFPLSLRRVEDLLHERGIDISHETIRVWWNRLGPMFATDIRKKRSAALRVLSQWRWHLGKIFVQINCETYYFGGLLIMKARPLRPSSQAREIARLH